MNARLCIVITLLLVVIFKISVIAYAEVNISDSNMHSSEQVLPSGVKLAKEELKAEFYKQALESYRSEIDSFRREMDNYKWIIQFSLGGLAILVALIGYISVEKSKSIVKKERSLAELSYEANLLYSTGHYKDAVDILELVDQKFRPQKRPFFNLWGSSLLQLAKQRTGDEKKRLLLEAAEKYKKAENFTRGTASYNLAAIYSLLTEKEECKKWLGVAKETGRMLPKAEFEKDDNFSNMWGEEWFEQLKHDLPE